MLTAVVAMAFVMLLVALVLLWQGLKGFGGQVLLSPNSQEQSLQAELTVATTIMKHLLRAPAADWTETTVLSKGDTAAITLWLKNHEEAIARQRLKGEK